MMSATKKVQYKTALYKCSKNSYKSEPTIERRRESPVFDENIHKFRSLRNQVKKDYLINKSLQGEVEYKCINEALKMFEESKERSKTQYDNTKSRKTIKRSIKHLTVKCRYYDSALKYNRKLKYAEKLAGTLSALKKLKLFYKEMRNIKSVTEGFSVMSLAD